YDPAKTKANFVMATSSTSANAIMASGTNKVYGSIHTGLGGAVNFGTNLFSAGDAAWVNGNQPGMQTGHSFDDMTMMFPDVSPPAGTGIVPSGNHIGGTNYDLALTNNNTLYVSSSQLIWAGNKIVLVSGANVTWWLKKGMAVSGNFAILIAPGASLKLYVGNTTGSAVTWTLSGKGVVNDGPPSAFQYYGLPTNTGFTYSGSHSFNGLFYAPQAAFTMSGGRDYYGAFVAKSINRSDGFSLHYDEAVANLQPAF
ncbi:MAG: hypothetical protein JWQ71_2602, partial [Pedosphaera sp.]|nr:hypothetical protein [Pedosphaera sp.]